MKQTRLTMFIPGDTPPDLGFDITWYVDYMAAVSSSEEFAGYFKPNSAGGKSNIMVLADSNTLLPITDFDISDTGAFSSAWGGQATEMRVSNNPLLEGVSSESSLTVIQANNTNLSELPPNIADGALIRVDNNGLNQEQVDDMFSQVIEKTNLTIENNGNADINLEQSVAIENLGGVIWETTSGILKFQTNASVTTAFNMFINSGADVDWYLDGVEHTVNSNIATFLFTDSSVKTIEVRGTDVNQGDWISMVSKSLTGTFDMSAMTSAKTRIDFSGNTDLTRIILPRTNGVMDQLMGYNSGISELRLDKLPGLVNSANIQIRLGDCPNLDTDTTALNLLSIDTNLVSGRQFWVNGTTPALDPTIKSQLQANNWTVVE